MRRLLPIALLGVACASPPLAESVSPRIEAVGSFEVDQGRPAPSGPADAVPCRLGSLFGTHFFLEAPAGAQGEVALIATWTRHALDAPGDAEGELLNKARRFYRWPLATPDELGTYLVLRLDEPGDLVPARYVQSLSTGSGRDLFRHEFVVDGCPADESE